MDQNLARLARKMKRFRQMYPVTPEHEYVDLLLTVEKGVVVDCEFFGEGRQVEPLTEPMLLKPITAG